MHILSFKRGLKQIVMFLVTDLKRKPILDVYCLTYCCVTRFFLLRAKNRLFVDCMLKLCTSSGSVCNQVEHRLSWRPCTRLEIRSGCDVRKVPNEIRHCGFLCNVVAKWNTRIPILTCSLFSLQLLHTRRPTVPATVFPAAAAAPAPLVLCSYARGRVAGWHCK